MSDSSLVSGRGRAGLLIAITLVIAVLGGTLAGAHPEDEDQHRRGAHGAEGSAAEPGTSHGVWDVGHGSRSPSTRRT